MMGKSNWHSGVGKHGYEKLTHHCGGYVVNMKILGRYRYGYEKHTAPAHPFCHPQLSHSKRKYRAHVRKVVA